MKLDKFLGMEGYFSLQVLRCWVLKGPSQLHPSSAGKLGGNWWGNIGLRQTEDAG